MGAILSVGTGGYEGQVIKEVRQNKATSNFTLGCRRDRCRWSGKRVGRGKGFAEQIGWIFFLNLLLEVRNQAKQAGCHLASASVKQYRLRSAFLAARMAPSACANNSVGLNGVSGQVTLSRYLP